jgi:predicted ATP-dependent serine protease
MPFYHTKCGGDVRVGIWGGKCTKCKKRWNPISALFNSEMRVIHEEKPEKISTRKPTSYAKWADKWHGVPTIASHLPNWPRWARVLTGLVFFGGIIFLIIWLVII